MAMLHVLFRLGSEKDKSIAASEEQCKKVAIEIMREADANKNGSIDVAEIKAWIRRGSPHAQHCMELTQVAEVPGPTPTTPPTPRPLTLMCPSIPVGFWFPVLGVRW